MAYKFKRKESVRKAVRRLCRRCVKDALERFHQENKLEAVHSVRKEIKKLRAVLRLIRDEIGERRYKKRTRSLREAADHLAKPRDAHVQANAFRGLVAHSRPGFSGQGFRQMQQMLDQKCREEDARFRKGGCRRIVWRLLRKQLPKYEKLKMPSKGWTLIREGLMRSYAAGREAQELVRREPTAENFHEWRKRVKDLWYHLQLLQPIWPERMDPIVEKLAKLGDCLGDDHDLHLLKQTVARKSVLPELKAEARRLTALIDSRRRTLQAEALALGGDFYSEKPLIFCGRLHRYWKVWRSKRGTLKTNHPQV